MNVVFETERLELKKFSAADAQGFYELNLDPEVLRYTGDVPFASVVEAETFIRNYNHYDRYGFGRWSVFLKDWGDYIGFCGLNYRPSVDEVDLGFRLRMSHWGKGYATEAARGSLNYGFKTYNLEKIVARAMKMNLASHRVLQKLGMRFQKTFEAEAMIWVQYEITREEFLWNRSSPII
jgi:RimJ/RimL family protein N-acetyltransferase